MDYVYATNGLHIPWFPCRVALPFVLAIRFWLQSWSVYCTMHIFFNVWFRFPFQSFIQQVLHCLHCSKVRLALFKQSLGLLCRTMTDQIILLQIVVQETSNKHARHDFLQKSSTFQHDTSKTFVFSPKIEYW